MRSAKLWARRSTLLVFALLFLLALPRAQTQALRRVSLSALVGVRSLFQKNPSGLEKEVAELKTERLLLCRQIEELSEQVGRASEPIAATAARVIYREPSSWNRRLWIAIGEKDNQKAGHRLVGKNSPVLLGGSLIGLVDSVEKNRSLVILLTDASIAPSVRAHRGGAVTRELKKHIAALFEGLMLKEKELFASVEERDRALENLAELSIKLPDQHETLHLAKGYLSGGAKVAWRQAGWILKGVGFNYDYADAYGEAKELRSGIPYGQMAGRPTPLLKVGDLLVTTGLDGIFPEGLNVARVTQVAPLKEGSHYYEIEAAMTAGDLEDLKVVSVLPPLMCDGALEQASL